MLLLHNTYTAKVFLQDGKTVGAKPRVRCWVGKDRWIDIFTVLMEPFFANAPLDQVTPGCISLCPRKATRAIHMHLLLFQLSVPPKASGLWYGWESSEMLCFIALSRCSRKCLWSMLTVWESCPLHRRFSKCNAKSTTITCTAAGLRQNVW